jgi:hypothetical protein
LEWECIEGHQWKASWNSASHGHWCPTCSTRLGERICREFFSQLFQNPFPKARPKWLVNKAGNQMELDGYCATLGIAFEHQGEHHYSTRVHFLHNKKFDLPRRQEDDALKSKLCAQRGIALVSVPQIPDRLPLDQVRTFIKEQLSPKGIPLPQGFETRDVDINKAYRTAVSREMLNSLRAIATEHGGKCLSTSYINAISKLTWQCAEGHQWMAIPSSVQQGEWCPECSGNVKLTIEHMHRLAKTRGGRCLSRVYVNSQSILLWQCAKGHRWKAVPRDIRQGKWCPFCVGRGKTIQDMQQLAAQHRGQCLSDTYKTNSTKLLWQCQVGHQWEAIPSNVLRGSWCPVCGHARGGPKRLSLQAMRAIAASRGGRCLSDDYVNSGTDLLWQCKEGHQWKATPNNIKRGTWCPVCFNERRGRRRRKAR